MYLILCFIQRPGIKRYLTRARNGMNDHTTTYFSARLMIVLHSSAPSFGDSGQWCLRLLSLSVN